MSRPLKTTRILKDLRQAQREIDAGLSSITAQLKTQADSTFGGGQPWGTAGLAGFGDCLIAHAKTLIELGEHFNAGKPPPWWLEQQATASATAAARTSTEQQVTSTAEKNNICTTHLTATVTQA